MLAYVPKTKFTGSPANEETNRADATALAQALGVDLFDYIQPRSNSSRLGTATNAKIREQYLLGKFNFNNSVLSTLPTDCNVIIYDDFLRSGRTLDKVSEPLVAALGAGRKIFGIVRTFKTCEEQQIPPMLPAKDEIFPLEPLSTVSPQQMATAHDQQFRNALEQLRALRQTDPTLCLIVEEFDPMLQQS